MRRTVSVRAFVFFILFLAVLGTRGGSSAHAQLSGDREYLIKAAFLYNFLKFVEWPVEALPEISDTITTCVVGEDPFGNALESIRGKTVKNRSLAIRRVEELRNLGTCQLVFISASEKNRLRKITDALKGRSVLTVGDFEGFLESGGIIRLFMQSNNIRFEINLDTAEQAQLKVSSRLLNLAKVVRGH